MELFNFLQSFIIIFWFCYSGTYIRQNKVSEVQKMIKYFYLLGGTYLLFIMLEIAFGCMYIVSLVNIQEVRDQINHDGHSVETVQYVGIATLGLLFVVYFISIAFVFTLYIRRYMRAYLQAMIEFHDFLNNYRQTPRSRFIRKY
jgi:hypothetical protein